MSASSRRMPAEWETHTQTWMAFPPANVTFGDEGSDSLETARATWADVARVIASHEPVTLMAGADQVPLAQRLAGPAVRVVPRDLDDAWMRDTGPTFVLEDEQSVAVDWVFNGWGAQDWAAWDKDQQLASEVAGHAGVALRHSALVNEGGGLHVDGAGTVLLTETVQLDADRNPGWTRETVEAEVHDQLGTRRAIWLPRGLTADYEQYGTRGHVDIVACFTPTGVVAVHSQPDPSHPDHEVTREVAALLRGATDASGRPLTVVEVPAPSADVDGAPGDYSYINHYVGNGFVIVGVFADPADAPALDLLARLYPGRRIETVDGRNVFAFGGGVHCITQQQPAVPDRASG